MRVMGLGDETAPALDHPVSSGTRNPALRLCRITVSRSAFWVTVRRTPREALMWCLAPRRARAQGSVDRYQILPVRVEGNQRWVFWEAPLRRWH